MLDSYFKYNAGMNIDLIILAVSNFEHVLNLNYCIRLKLFIFFQINMKGRVTLVKTLLANSMGLVGSGNSFTIKGCVRRKRGLKNNLFLVFNDGSSVQNLQVVLIEKFLTLCPHKKYSNFALLKTLKYLGVHICMIVLYFCFDMLICSSLK